MQNCQRKEFSYFIGSDFQLIFMNANFLENLGKCLFLYKNCGHVKNLVKLDKNSFVNETCSEIKPQVLFFNLKILLVVNVTFFQ